MLPVTTEAVSLEDAVRQLYATYGLPPPSIPSETTTSASEDGPSRAGQGVIKAVAHTEAQSASEDPSGTAKKRRATVSVDGVPAIPALMNRGSFRKPLVLKKSRGQKACTGCRALKMRCENSDNPPCSRCVRRKINCVFTDAAVQGVFLVSDRDGQIETSPRPASYTGLSMTGSSSRSPDDDNLITDEVVAPTSVPSISDQRQSSRGSPRIVQPSTDDSDRASALSDDAMFFDGWHHFGLDTTMTQFTQDSVAVTAGVLGDLEQALGPGTDEETLRGIHLAFDDSHCLPADQDDWLITALGQEPAAFPQGPSIGVPTPPMPSQNHPKEIQAVMDIASDSEMQELFRVFFDHINVCWGLLRSDYHHVARVKERSSFLLLTICTIASRFIIPRTHVYPNLYSLVRSEADSKRSPRTIETVQAYLLLAMYAVHPLKEESGEDIGWSLICRASRLALDLKLHRPITGNPKGRFLSPEDLPKENENRLRTWLLSFALDKSYSHSRGRTSSLPNLGMAHIPWARIPPGAIQIAAYADLQLITTRTLETIFEDAQPINLVEVTEMYERKMGLWRHMLTKTLHDDWVGSNLSGDQRLFILGTLEYYSAYWCMVVCSFALQDGLDRHGVGVPYFFFKCANYAFRVISVTKEQLSKQTSFKHAPDNRFVFLTYVAVTLLKFTRNELQSWSPLGAQTSTANITAEVSSVADLMESVAVDQDHMAAVCATLLRSLLKELFMSGATQFVAVGLTGWGDLHESSSPTQRIRPIVRALLEHNKWTSVVVPGFEGRERPATEDFLHVPMDHI